jgi:hypothetical protein
MATPSCLDQKHRLLEMIAHRVAKFQLHPRPIARSVADGELPVAVEIFDQNIIPLDPLSVLSQMDKMFHCFRRSRLIFKEFILGLPLHI